MIKKTLLILFTFTLIQITLWNTTAVLAQSTQQTSNKDSVGVDQLFYKFNYQDKNKTDTKLSYVKALPGGTWEEILTGVIKTVLGVTGSLALVSFTVAGILFLTAQGQEDKLTKAKHVLLWSVVALAIIAVSYAIVIGISQLQFF